MHFLPYQPTDSLKTRVTLKAINMIPDPKTINLRPNVDRPLVSVVVLCHNHASYIRQTLENIFSQFTNFPFETIINDDASSDETTSVIRDTPMPSTGVTLISHGTNKYSQGINVGKYPMSLARGEYLAFCEGDDFWISSKKLQRQVDAMRRNRDLDLCVHPATRLSMRTGKQKQGFDYGPKERVIQPETVIARHNQFAPTASVLMRTRAAQNLPDWFFNEHGLPVGDFFIEAILGRKGVLYLPDTMSVYRRDVPSSYTNQFRKSSGPALEQSLERMLYFTEKLRGMEGIPEAALDQRLSYVRLNYALQFLIAGDRERFIRTSRDIRLRGHGGLQAILATMRRSRMAFAAGRRAFDTLRRLKD